MPGRGGCSGLNSADAIVGHEAGAVGMNRGTPEAVLGVLDVKGRSVEQDDAPTPGDGTGTIPGRLSPTRPDRRITASIDASAFLIRSDSKI